MFELGFNTTSCVYTATSILTGWVFGGGKGRVGSDFLLLLLGTYTPPPPKYYIFRNSFSSSSVTLGIVILSNHELNILNQIVSTAK